MAVLLRTSQSQVSEAHDYWCATDGSAAPDGTRAVPDLSAQLNAALRVAAQTWFALARQLSLGPGAQLAHMPSAAANVSDFGTMLAWSQLLAKWVQDTAKYAVICDDPWLFRHLAELPGVEAGRPPGIRAIELRLRLRGALARARVSVRMALAALRCHAAAASTPTGALAFLVYGHPASADGPDDAYFGSLVRAFPDAVRIIHVDCPAERAGQIGLHGGINVSLHGFGSALRALMLWHSKWKPSPQARRNWLVRRAAMLEGGTGQAAMIAWQIHCQEAWLRRTKPRLVVWPWENHSWERSLVLSARRLGVATVGYQHSTIADLEWNYSPLSNTSPDSLPERVVCSGQAWRERLVKLGWDPAHLEIGGALRFNSGPGPRHDPTAPVFVPLPGNLALAEELVDAVIRQASKYRFMVKPHPLTPLSVPTIAGLEVTDRTLGELPSLSTVLYCGTSVALQAVLAGIPVVRFRARAQISSDVLPPDFPVIEAGSEGLDGALKQASANVPTALKVEEFFGPIRLDVWRRVLGAPA